MAKQTRITIETESLVVLKGRTPTRGWCAQCNSEGEMVPIEGVAVVSNLEPSAVRDWIESDELHLTHSTDGAAMICLKSLLKRVCSQTETP